MGGRGQCSGIEKEAARSELRGRLSAPAGSGKPFAGIEALGGRRSLKK